MQRTNGKMLENVLKQYYRLSSQSNYSYVVSAVQFLKKVIAPNQQSKAEQISQLFRKQIFVSFNGGKDATIVLFLTAIAYSELNLSVKDVQALYFKEPDPFAQVDAFIQEIREGLGLEIIAVQKNGFAESLRILKQKYPIEYVIMGTRKTDPYCHDLQPLAKTDVNKGYPEMIRVNPILDWSYLKVWDFIREFEIPFCSLYLKGYTYLGNTKNTKPNENLIVDKEKQIYRPAWEAEEDHQLLSRK